MTASTSYSYTVVARDGAGHSSPASAAASITTLSPPPPDTTAPTAPVLSRTGVTETSVSLSWTASTDNVGVTNYLVYRGSTLVGTVTAGTLAFTDTGLTAGTTYGYTVKARDAAQNLSVASNSVSATTTATLPPSTIQCTAGSGTVTFSTIADNNSGYFSATVNGVYRVLPDAHKSSVQVTLTSADIASAAQNNGVVKVVVTHNSNQGDVILGTGYARVAANGTVTCA